MSSAPPPPPARRRGPYLLGALLLVAAAGVLYFVWAPPVRRPPPNLEGAFAANTRGVGWAEHFDFDKAESEFAEAVRLAPDWPTAKINLGISLFNQDKTRFPEKHARAREVFGEVLAADPQNKHAHYCLGVIEYDLGHVSAAFTHFEAVNKADPADAPAWYRLGMTHPDGNRSAAARRCFEEALRRDPYLVPARYNLAQLLYETDEALAKQMMAENDALRTATWASELETKYSVMGKYADVIGRDPRWNATQMVGPLPAFDEPAKIAAPAGEKWVGDGPLSLFDFDGDGRPDVFLGRAATDGRPAWNVLLRNADGTAFATAKLPAALGHAGIPVPGDFDNDGSPDLALVAPNHVQLLRNTGKGEFTDVTAAAGLGPVAGKITSAQWLDIDQDGDLDLVLAAGGVVVYENVGEAAPGAAALTPKFRRLDKGLPPTPATHLVAADLDGDGDIDLLALADGAAPTPILNDRLLRFHAGPPLPDVPAATWLGGVVLDLNHDERADLVLLRKGDRPVVLLAKDDGFKAAATNSPPLTQCVATDLDLDGWADVVGLDERGRPTLLHNTGNDRLEVMPEVFGLVDQRTVPCHALAVADLDGDGDLDLLTVSADGPQVRRSRGNGNRGVYVTPTGARDKGSDRRVNADGTGTSVAAQHGSFFSSAFRLSAESGPGRSLLPTVLGLGRAERADVIRARWPDAVVQAELGVAAGPYRLAETNRKGTSCPVLMTWDGERFVFVTDFLGGGALGESGPDASVRPPRPEESVKIEAHQLRAKNGMYTLKIAEPMDEVLYLDRVRLDVVQHPKGVVVLPDERFALAPPYPSQELLAFPTRHEPKAATDDAGRDVLPRLRARDGQAVDTFAVRSWLGYAADHSLTLDFGAVPSSAGQRWYLVLAGWTEYPYPESMYAAGRAGVALVPPVLERLAADGRTWEPVCDLGFPAGLTRVMTRELPGFLPTENTVLRVRTNMQVYWDHVFLAPAADLERTAHVHPLDPAYASLAARGFMREVRPFPGGPLGYDDAHTEPVAVTRWTGNLTRLGAVTELLNAADDRFVLCGPGDEITVAFDASRLGTLPVGWERSFVLRTWGYCKDTSPTTVGGGRVGPLPFRAMPNYPAFGTATPPATDAVRWHTRPAGGRLSIP